MENIYYERLERNPTSKSHVATRPSLLYGTVRQCYTLFGYKVRLRDLEFDTISLLRSGCHPSYRHFRFYHPITGVKVYIDCPCTHHEDIWGNEGIAPLILNLGTR